MTSGDQLRPYEPPYMKLWRERLDASKLSKAIKSAQAKARKKAKKWAKK